MMSVHQKKIDALIEIGADAIIDSTLSKLISIQTSRYQNNIKEISSELVKFEKKYNMSSEECYRRFESGELGDGGDFFEWVALYDNVLLYKKRIKTLESAIKG